MERLAKCLTSLRVLAWFVMLTSTQQTLFVSVLLFVINTINSRLICDKLIELYLMFLHLSSVEKVTEGEEVQERIVKGWDER